MNGRTDIAGLTEGRHASIAAGAVSRRSTGELLARAGALLVALFFVAHGLAHLVGILEIFGLRGEAANTSTLVSGLAAGSPAYLALGVVWVIAHDALPRGRCRHRPQAQLVAPRRPRRRPRVAGHVRALVRRRDRRPRREPGRPRRARGYCALVRARPIADVAGRLLDTLSLRPRISSQEKPTMKPSRLVVVLSALVAALALAASLAGLLLPGEAASTAATTVRGDAVRLFGEGLYRLDSVFTGAAYRGTDLVTVALGVPLLLAGLVFYRRGSLRGGLVLSGALAYILYVYASLSLNAAYNSFFLVYVVLFSASFYALVTLLRTAGLDALGSRALERLPRRLPGVFFLVAGAATLIIWTLPLATALLSGSVPARLDAYSTSVTSALDLALITPACFACGVLILRRRPSGYRLAFPLLGIVILLGPGFVTQTLWQLSAGVRFTPGEAVGPIAGFGDRGTGRAVGRDGAAAAPAAHTAASRRTLAAEASGVAGDAVGSPARGRAPRRTRRAPSGPCAEVRQQVVRRGRGRRPRRLLRSRAGGDLPAPHHGEPEADHAGAQDVHQLAGLVRREAGVPEHARPCRPCRRRPRRSTCRPWR